VCAHFRVDEPDAPAPPCVQRKGDVVVMPGGWFHGTCNTAPGWTVGWGGQGRRLPMALPPSAESTARVAGARFATAKMSLLGARDIDVLVNNLAHANSFEVEEAFGQKGVRLTPFADLGYAAQAPRMALRSLFTQYLGRSARDAERMPIIQPLCAVVTLSDPARTWLDPFPEDLQGEGAHALLPLGSAMKLVFDDTPAGGGGSGGGLVERALASGSAAVWRDRPALRSVRDATAEEQQHHLLFCSYGVNEWKRQPSSRDEL